MTFIRQWEAGALPLRRGLSFLLFHTAFHFQTIEYLLKFEILFVDLKDQF